MDVNGTRFHLLLGFNDWGNCTEDGTTPLHQVWQDADPCADSGSGWDDARAEVTLKPCLLQIVAGLSHTPPQSSERRGADRDRYGNWYWIDRSGGKLLVNSVGTGNTTHFWSLQDGIDRGSLLDGGSFMPGPGEQPSLPDPLALSGLVVTEDHYLVVGVLQPAGILVFDLYAGGPPLFMLWPVGVPFKPIDMAPMPGGGLWILDRENARYWALDRHFRVISREQAELLLSQERAELFQPTSGAERRRVARTFPSGILLNSALPLPIFNAVAIEALPDGSVLILESDPQASFAFIYRFLFAQQLGSPVSTEVMLTLIEPDKQDQFTLKGYDFAFVPEHSEDGETIPDRLYVVPPEGNQVYPFNIWQQDNQLQLQPLPNYFPMRMFGGKALVSAGNQAWYDFTDGWVPLVELKRDRYATCAQLYTSLGDPNCDTRSNPDCSPPPFDGGLPGCVWHRLMLDACIPPETTVQIYSRAADVAEELASTQWQLEPPLYLRGNGSELPYTEPVTGELNGTWELLFQAASGRYLQLWIVLTGNGRSTPHLRALRVYYPRFSYLDHYLPAVYREDPVSASFLDRFLANLEGFFTAIEDRIATVQVLFDARSTTSEALEWLASWFGIALDVTWDDDRRRLFLRHAMQCFAYRGTIAGLLMLLRLTFDTSPDESIFTSPLGSNTSGNGIRIVEAYTARQAVPRPTWSANLGGAALRQAWQLFLQQNGLDGGAGKDFPLVPPTDANVAAAWAQFAQTALGFLPSTGDADQPSWQDFLSRRYEKIDMLNSAYSTNYTDFEAILLPQALPPDGPALQDWYAFQSIVLVMRNNAHTFTVLLPLPDSSAVQQDMTARIDLATRIIELGKPAHTTFSVKFYLAALRIGATRLGIDTFIDLGSRTPQLMAPMILGQSYLLESYLASQQTLDATNREVLKHEQYPGYGPIHSTGGTL